MAATDYLNITKKRIPNNLSNFITLIFNKIDIINYDVKHKQFAIDNLRKLEELKN